MKKILLLICVMAIGLCIIGCGKKQGPYIDPYDIKWVTADDLGPTIVDMSMYIGVPGSGINDGNIVQEMIAEETGIRVHEYYLLGQTPEEALGSLLVDGFYQDFWYFEEGLVIAYEGGILVAWDDYIEKYPNIKYLYSDEEWEQLRQSDGHIYWCPIFCEPNIYSSETKHYDSAFWIQTRVLEEAGYPKITTIDEYLEILAQYAENHPTMPNGDEIIPFTFYCAEDEIDYLTGPPMLISGHMDKGYLAVDDIGGVPTIVDYNISDTAREYYGELNQAYKAGILDQNFAEQTYNEYLKKISSGRVLGMYGEYRDFEEQISTVYSDNEVYFEGCDYVPLALVECEGMENRYHDYYKDFNPDGGIAVTTGCDYPDLAFNFINDLLEQEIHDLRFWGIEGVDYEVDGEWFYRTSEMRTNAEDPSYQADNLCPYQYFPQWDGISKKGFNAMKPYMQPSEYKETLPSKTVECFDAYKCNNYVDMLGSVIAQHDKWYSIYTLMDDRSFSSPGAVAYWKINNILREQLLEVIVANDFDKAWNSYLDAYEGCCPLDLINEAQEELDSIID